MDGLNEQEIKHRAGWTKGSTRMLNVYANFTDDEINNSIYEKYGLKTEEVRHVTLKKCPRCSNILRPDDRYCSQCALVLDQKALQELQAYEDDFKAVYELLRKQKKKENNS